MAAQDSNQAGRAEESAETSKEVRPPRAPNSATRNPNANVQLKGRSTFLMPRSVRPLGVPADKQKADQEEDANPKSNDEFRKMFIKK